MAEGKNKIIIYRDWVATFRELTDAQAGKLIKHLYAYVNDENPEDPTGLLKMAWIPMKAQLKRDLKKWEQFVEKQKVNGKNGGRPKTQITQAFSEKPKKADTVIIDKVIIDTDTVITDKVKYNFRQSLLDFGFEENLVNDWLVIRKNKKATNTETAFTGFTKEVVKTGLDKNEALRICVERSWSGLKSEWLKTESNGIGHKASKIEQTFLAGQKAQEHFKNL